MTRPSPTTPRRPRRSPEPAILVIFGATGDLTERKLMPALYRLARDGALPDQLRIVGFARRDWNDDQFRAYHTENTCPHLGDEFEEEQWGHFARRLYFQQGTFDDAAAFEALAQKIEELEKEHDNGGNLLFYLARSRSGWTKRGWQTVRRVGSG
jgi:glucose-6-phosphate 1-dehydrogenase